MSVFCWYTVKSLLQTMFNVCDLWYIQSNLYYKTMFNVQQYNLMIKSTSWRLYMIEILPRISYIIQCLGYLVCYIYIQGSLAANSLLNTMIERIVIILNTSCSMIFNNTWGRSVMFSWNSVSFTSESVQHIIIELRKERLNSDVEQSKFLELQILITPLVSSNSSNTY
jgi:hypothetical protein